MSMLTPPEFMKRLQSTEIPVYKDNKSRLWYNIPAAFDIETSSFYSGPRAPENKRACMYIWMFGIGDYVTYGRTWDQFEAFIETLSDILNTPNIRLVVYVHNLPYEFQFIRKRFAWDKVFILDDRKPVRAVTKDGIEFRCSLKLSGGKSLANVAKDLVHHNIEKKVGDLDYSLIRHSKTQLTERELGYCEYDIRVLTAYISEKIEQDGNITLIPLTNTGYVRNFCRKRCFPEIQEVQTDNGGINYDSV